VKVPAEVLETRGERIKIQENFFDQEFEVESAPTAGSKSASSATKDEEVVAAEQILQEWMRQHPREMGRNLVQLE